MEDLKVEKSFEEPDVGEDDDTGSGPLSSLSLRTPTVSSNIPNSSSPKTSIPLMSEAQQTMSDPSTAVQCGPLSLSAKSTPGGRVGSSPKVETTPKIFIAPLSAAAGSEHLLDQNSKAKDVPVNPETKKRGKKKRSRVAMGKKLRNAWTKIELLEEEKKNLEIANESLRKEVKQLKEELKVKTSAPKGSDSGASTKKGGYATNRQLPSCSATRATTVTQAPVHPSCEVEEVELSTSDESFDEEDEELPSELVLAVKRLCDSKGIADYDLLQNPANLRNIAILADGAENLEDCLHDLNSQFENYSMFVVKGQLHIHTNQLAWSNFLLVEGFAFKRTASCELVLRASATGQDSEIFFVVAPAHMMFSDAENQDMKSAINNDLLNAKVNDMPPHKVYQFRPRLVGVEGPHDGQQEQGEPLIVPTTHSRLISYRYKYPRGGVAGMSPNEPDVYEAEDQASPLEPEFCLNDITLLQFEATGPEEVQQRLQAYEEFQREQLVEITTWNQLRNYNRPRRPIRIAVKNLTGRLVNNFHTVQYQRNEGIAHHLLFTLDEGNLVAGDSGSIVYKVKRDGNHYPLGMLVDSVTIEDFGRTYYKALILNQALEDLRSRYQLTHLTLYNTSSRRQHENNRAAAIR